MRKHNLAFIDIETTGLDVIDHEIIEIGCVLTTPNLKVIEEFELKIKPEHLEIADPTAMKINHYKEELWIDAIGLPGKIADQVAQKRVERRIPDELVEFVKRRLAEHGYKGEITEDPSTFTASGRRCRSRASPPTRYTTSSPSGSSPTPR